VFRTVQVIYTAAPIFSPGMSDHLPQRIAILPGKAVVAVPPPEKLVPLPHSPVPMPKRTDAGAGGYALKALTNAATRVQQTSVGKRHDTILREARGLARFVNAGLLTRADVTNTLRSVGEQVGKPAKEIDAVIAWALARPSGLALPDRLAR
jgi:hypothetical protein